MYRLSYPDDPGMHNSRFPKRKPRNHRNRHELCSIWNEILQSYWLTACFGCIAVFTVLGLQYYNESWAVQISRSVEESLRSVRKLTTTEVAFEENNNKLVYLVGKLATDEELSDPDYGVAVKAAKLRKRHEIYQWVEEKTIKEAEGNHSKSVISYTYYKTWSPVLIQSDQFQNPVDYANPKEMPENSYESVKVLKVGNFILSKGFLDKINNFQPFTGHIRPQFSGIKLHAGLYYHTEDVWNPQIGDLRVEFAMAGVAGEHAETVTIIAKQEGRMLNPYVTEAGDAILLLHFGWKAPENVINSELLQNNWLIWMLRFASWFLLLLVINWITMVLKAVVHPSFLLQDILHLGRTYITFSFTVFLYALNLTSTWLFHRPLLGLLFLVISLLPLALIGVKLYRKDNRENSRHRRI